MFIILFYELKLNIVFLFYYFFYLFYSTSIISKALIYDAVNMSRETIHIRLLITPSNKIINPIGIELLGALWY